MSDYLQNLVTRTLSPEAGVRPQLRSAFEPLPFHSRFTAPTAFEFETEADSNPLDSLPPTATTPLKPVLSREQSKTAPTISSTRDKPGEAVRLPMLCPTSGEMPASEHKDQSDLAPVQPVHPPQQARREPPMELPALQRLINRSLDLPLGNRLAVPTTPVTPRPGPVRAAGTGEATPVFDTLHSAPALVPQQAVESATPRSDPAVAIAIPSVASVATVSSLNPLSAPIADPPRPTASPIRSHMVQYEERRSERFAVAAIRPVAPVTPTFSPQPVLGVARPPATIQVTIGRVEVRAVPPPQAASRATVTQPPVMSLEEYLGRRAGGGRR
jgi:hypothetical protein